MKKPHLNTLLLLGSLVLALVLAACQPDATPTPSVQVLPTTTPGAQVSRDVAGIESLPPQQSLPPTEIEFPDIELILPVVPMGWKVVTKGSERTTVWDVPEDEVGWFVTSAGAGGSGTTILSGYQAQGARVLAPLAMGDVEVGQEVHLTDADGLKFVYRIAEISKPIPVGGATAEEAALAQAYIEPGDSARLVLITGWPDFTTTHRIFAVAEFVGLMK